MSFKEFYICEDTIKNIEQHLRDRGVDPDKIKVIMDKESNRAIFLLYNLSGILIGYQQYNPNQPKAHFKGEAGKDIVKYYTYVSKQLDRKESQISVWGLEYVDFENDKEIWVCEGIFDTIRLINEGLSAIATLTSTPSPQLKQWFKILNKKIIVVADNDKAGQSLKSIADKYFVVPEPYKDLNEMSQEEAHKWIEKIKKEI